MPRPDRISIGSEPGVLEYRVGFEPGTLRCARTQSDVDTLETRDKVTWLQPERLYRKEQLMGIHLIFRRSCWLGLAQLAVLPTCAGSEGSVAGCVEGSNAPQKSLVVPRSRAQGSLLPGVEPARWRLKTTAHQTGREFVVATIDEVILHFGSFAKNVASS